MKTIEYYEITDFEKKNIYIYIYIYFLSEEIATANYQLNLFEWKNIIQKGSVGSSLSLFLHSKNYSINIAKRCVSFGSY